MVMDVQLARRAADTLRFLAADAVQKANSGHPGMPMGMADCALILWLKYLRFNPAEPLWPARDRFVLSAGHGSMLLYSLLHLFGFDLPRSQLQQFRQWGSHTPGHPEYEPARGVEITTGPLGQGVGNAVGMAIAAKMMAARFNTEDFQLFNSRVFAICGDGDLMEGVSHEAVSLAGHLGLGNLILIYDDNHITIEGDTALAFSEDVPRRFEACGWHTLAIDGHDHDQIAAALEAGQAETARPTLIAARTHIAFGCPHKQDDAEAHGAPLGEEEVLAAKRNLGFPTEPAFFVPDDVRALFAARREELIAAYAAWQEKWGQYRQAHPEKAARWEQMVEKALPEDLEDRLLAAMGTSAIATRNAAGDAQRAAASLIPGLVGGSADLAPSTMTLMKDYADIAPGRFEGRNFHFGVREHGMGSILNGLAAYGGFIPFGATFLVFADYMRPSIRLAALMGLQVVYIFTHDSIFVGEDGPTHQPVEHLASLRAIPNLVVLRPADATEAAIAWAVALRRQDGPTALCLTRQKLPVLDRSRYAPAAQVARGAYVLADCKGEPELLLLASGSEVSLALGVQTALAAQGRPTRVISFPSWELFEAQPAEYRREVLPAGPRRVAIEAGVGMGWERYVGEEGLVIGINRFGASAPYQVLAEKYGLTVEAVLATIEKGT